MEATKQQWNIRRQADGESFGPVSMDELRSLVTRRQIGVEDFVRPTPGGEWQELGRIDEIGRLLASGERRRRRALPDDDDFDMTPMIDVTFLLLIFFMLTASFQILKALTVSQETESLERQQTDATAPGFEQFDDRILIGVDAQDRYSFRSTADPTTPQGMITRDELHDALVGEGTRLHTSQLLIIADDRASHEAVVAVIDVATAAKISSISLADVQIAAPSTAAPTIQRQQP